jgi:hypothetical protein
MDSHIAEVVCWQIAVEHLDIRESGTELLSSSKKKCIVEWCLKGCLAQGS